MTVIETSIEGINREIQRREDALRHRKSWYLSDRSPWTYSMYGFYFVGYKKMKEIERLKLILNDLYNWN